MKLLYYLYPGFYLIVGLNISNFYGQDESVTLSFTANHECTYVELDSIIIENLTQGGSTVSYYPYTVITFLTTNINNIVNQQKEFLLFQNFPNPFSNKTSFKLFVPVADLVEFTVYDLLGRSLTKYQKSLNPGKHKFNFYSCNKNIYILVAKSNRESQSLIIVQRESANRNYPEIKLH